MGWMSCHVMSCHVMSWQVRSSAQNAESLTRLHSLLKRGASKCLSSEGARLSEAAACRLQEVRCMSPDSAHRGALCLCLVMADSLAHRGKNLLRARRPALRSLRLRRRQEASQIVFGNVFVSRRASSVRSCIDAGWHHEGGRVRERAFPHGRRVVVLKRKAPGGRF